MRFVLCDDDRIMCTMVDTVLTSAGHEVLGVAHTTADAYNLILAARPDAVIADLSVGYNQDFDVLDAAAEVGAQAIVFSMRAEADLLSRYVPRPPFIAKPDFAALEQAISRLVRSDAGPVRQEDRRARPARLLTGPVPIGPSDAGAFFEALSEAVAGDALASIDLPGEEPPTPDGLALAPYVVWVVRQTDRLLGSPSAVRIFLAGAGPEGAEAVLERLRRSLELPAGARLRAIVVQPGEAPADAFDRLKHSEDVRPPAATTG